MILLTGATGFVGSYVLDELLSKDYDVVAAATQRSQITRTHPRLRWINWDLGDPETWINLPRECEGIIHLASTLSLNPFTVMDIDVQGMWPLMKIWDDCPFVYCSSTDVYGPLQMVPAREDHPLSPSQWYGLGKLICEQQLVLMGRMKRHPQFVIYRVPYVLGKHQRFASSLVGRLIKVAISGEDIFLPQNDNGESQVFGHSWAAARDIARWIVEALHNCHPGIYNVSSGFFRWGELAQLLSALISSFSQIHIQDNENRTMGLCAEERRFSVDKFAQTYGMHAVTTLEATLQEIISGTDFNKRENYLGVATMKGI